MTQWKKIVTSGSDGLNISALNMTLGADAPGNANLLATTTVQDAISQLNNVVGLIAPSAPDGLSATGFGTLAVSNNFSARNQNLTLISNLTTDTTPEIQATNFFDGGSGTLSASISTDGGSNFTEIGNVALTSETNNGTYNQLIISNNVDANSSFPSIPTGFFDILTAKISPTGLTANSVNNYDRTILKLVHSTTGEATSPSFTIISDPATSITNLNFTYNETNNFHYQSGIKFLGLDDSISTSYSVTIDSNANFINTDKKIANLDDSPNCFRNQNKTITEDTWTPGDTHHVTHSSHDVFNNVFNLGNNVVITARKFKAANSSPISTSTTKTIPKLLVDSTVEDETNPSDGAQTTSRSGSGKGHAPTFELGNTDITKAGQSFDKTQELTDTDNFELQFAGSKFFFPPQTNYSDHIPSGPNYSAIGGDSSNLVNPNVRYALFNIGTIENAFQVDLVIHGAEGFDTIFGTDPSFQQSSHNFQLGIIVIETGTSNRVTNWIDANAPHDTVSDTTLQDYDKGAVIGGTIASSGNLVRNVTFGAAGVQTGTVYARIGFSANTTRKFNYIYKTN